MRHIRVSRLIRSKKLRVRIEAHPSDSLLRGEWVLSLTPSEVQFLQDELDNCIRIAKAEKVGPKVCASSDCTGCTQDDPR